MPGAKDDEDPEGWREQLKSRKKKVRIATHGRRRRRSQRRFRGGPRKDCGLKLRETAQGSAPQAWQGSLGDDSMAEGQGGFLAGMILMLSAFVGAVSNGGMSNASSTRRGDIGA